MPRAFLFLVLVAWALVPGTLSAQEELTPSSLPEFFASYDQTFRSLDAAYDELINGNLPLRNWEGKPLVRRPIEEQREGLAGLREIAHQLAAQPKDLVLIAKLVFGTESLADDLFDLAQTAYDNDSEELAKRLTDLQITMDHHRGLLAAYLLAVAAEKQDRLVQLEREKTELERQLKEAVKQQKPSK